MHQCINILTNSPCPPPSEGGGPRPAIAGPGGWLCEGDGLPTLLLDSPLGRARGWLFRRASPSVQAVLLAPCRAVHFWGTREVLDVLFLRRDGTILLHRRCPPWSRPLTVRDADMVLEIASRFCPVAWNPRSICILNPRP